jgi:hypothetical protein
MGLVNPFTVLSDHNNLQYFMTAQKLLEMQVHWSQVLSRFNFQLRLRAGKKSQRPDALSRRQQDMPQGETKEPYLPIAHGPIRHLLSQGLRY